MANYNGPTGLKPVRHRNGVPCVVTNAYSIDAAYATKIFRGDAVVVTGTGNQVELAAAGSVTNVGVFAGCEYTNAVGKRIWSKFWPADSSATDIVASVWDDPQQVFEIQYGNTAAETPAVGDLRTGIDLAIGTPSEMSGYSGAYLDHASKAVLGTEQMRLERLVPAADNEWGDFAKFEVTFLNHVLATKGAAVA